MGLSAAGPTLKRQWASKSHFPPDARGERRSWLHFYQAERGQRQRNRACRSGLGRLLGSGIKRDAPDVGAER